MPRPSTAITEIVRVERFRIDALELRVQLRALELGLAFHDVAIRLGVNKSRLTAMVRAPAIRLETLERLERALEFTRADWERELPPPPPTLEESYRHRLARIRKTASGT